MRNRASPGGVLLLLTLPVSLGACPMSPPPSPPLPLEPGTEIVSFVHALSVLLLFGCWQALQLRRIESRTRRDRARALLSGPAVLLFSVALTAFCLALEAAFGTGGRLLDAEVDLLLVGWPRFLGELLRVSTMLGLLLAAGLSGPVCLARAFFRLDEAGSSEQAGEQEPYFGIRRRKD